MNLLVGFVGAGCGKRRSSLGNANTGAKSFGAGEDAGNFSKVPFTFHFLRTTP